MRNEADSKLREQVMKELDWEPSVDAADIGVAARDGVITLSGHVTHYTEKVAAEQAARRVSGVRAIAQEIEVRLNSESKVMDDEIAGRALKIIAWESLLPDDSVQVRVEKGWITLTGHVDWHFQREAAERAVHRLTGVRGVSNLLAVKPRVQPEDVRQRIEDAFRRNAELKARHVTVAVEKNGRVLLNGRVQTWRERRAAELASWSASGVQHVENHVAVG
jgi:osmotically-inducible protein OsmY